jgi:formylglycine-generating enzyme required for sulfatase activity
MTRVTCFAMVAALVAAASDSAAPLLPKERFRYFTNSIGMKFVWISPGSFLMGSADQEEQDEFQHKVTLTKGFYLGVYSVTQEQWRRVLGTNPSMRQDERNLPVENVSWDDCRAFLEKMGRRDKRVYRLPTEAEWEYACRAGSTTTFHFGDALSADSQANYNGNFPYGKAARGKARNKTTPVGSFPSNAWGLHDMHGNVWQWCADWYDPYPRKEVVDPGPHQEPPRVAEFVRQLSSPKFGERQAASKALAEIGMPAVAALRQAAKHGPDLETQRRAAQLVASIAGPAEFRVLRGGSFRSPGSLVRSANRSGLAPESRGHDIGFRAATD